MSRSIEIRDVGPVEHLTIPVPDGGGIVVLRGRNGLGKSHSLTAVGALVGGGRPVSRDGSLGATVEGLGARLTVGRRASHSGEVEVSHLEGEDPSLLVDPGIKDPAAADAARIKALLRLSRAEVDVDAFAELVGGRERLEELCRASSLDPRSDVPAMAAAIKRDLEAAARKAEQASQNALAKADGVRTALEGFAEPAARVHDSAEAAREAHTRAVREHSALESRQRDGAAVVKAAGEARAALAELGEGGTEEAVSRARSRVAMSESRLEQIRKELREAEDEDRDARAALAQQTREAAQRAALERAVEAAAEVKTVEAADLETAAEAVAAASAELEAWALHAETARMRAEIEEHAKRGAAHQVEGAELREAARGTEAVVLAAVRKVCGDDMELQEGRLWVRTGERTGRELFCELSPGERWRRALDIAVKAVGAQGLLVVRQEAYEAMDPINRREVAEYARELSVVIVTAECDEGDVRAEVETFAEVPASAE